MNEGSICELLEAGNVTALYRISVDPGGQVKHFMRPGRFRNIIVNEN